MTAYLQAMVAAEEKERRTVEKATARKNRYWKERAEKNRQIREGRHDNDKNTVRPLGRLLLDGCCCGFLALASCPPVLAEVVGWFVCLFFVF